MRGFDPFMNLVIDETTEFRKDGSKHSIGMVVVRGNSVVMLEAKDRVWWKGGLNKKNMYIIENVKTPRKTCKTSYRAKFFDLRWLKESHFMFAKY